MQEDDHCRDICNNNKAENNLAIYKSRLASSITHPSILIRKNIQPTPHLDGGGFVVAVVVWAGGCGGRLVTLSQGGWLLAGWTKGWVIVTGHKGLSG